VNTIGDLIGGIKVKQAAIAASLAAGNAASWDSYQRMVGEHQGLGEALDILNNLIKEDESYE
jgi:hypothetical protein